MNTKIKTFLVLALLPLLCGAQVINEAQIRQEITTKLANNNTKSISAAVHRALMLKVIDFVTNGGNGVAADSLASTGYVPYFKTTTGNLANSPFQVGLGRVGLGVSPAYPLDITGDINTSSSYRIGGVKFADRDAIYNNIYNRNGDIKKIKIGTGGVSVTEFFNEEFYFKQNDLTNPMVSIYQNSLNIGHPLTSIYTNAVLRIGGTATTRGIQLDGGASDANRVLIQNSSGILEQYSNASKLSSISRANKIVTKSIGGNLTDTSAALSFWGYDVAALAQYEQARIISRRAKTNGDYFGILDLEVESDDSPYTLLSLDGNTLFTSVSEKFRVKKDVHLATLSGNVGIGTTLPTAKLNVLGTTLLDGTTTLSSYLNLPVAGSGAVAARGVAFQGNEYVVGYGTEGVAGSNIIGPVFSRVDYSPYSYRWGKHSGAALLADGSNFTTQMVLTNDGNLGINTPSPDTKLHAVGADNAWGIAASAPSGRIRMSGYITGNSSPTIQFVNSSGGAYSIGTIDAESQYFKISGSTQMLLNSSGNLGVGTTSITEKLTVNGAISAGLNGSSVNIYLTGSGVHSIRSTTTSGEALYIDSGAGGVASAATIFRSSNGLLERMRIAVDGNVGINTDTPTSKLHVVGIPEYANNAAAVTGGLTVGAFYHTGGTLKIVIP